MKTTLLSSLFLSSLCLSLTAFSASEPKRKPAESPAQKSKMEEAWDHIEDAGADLRDGVSGAVNDFIGFSRDAIHERPDLQMLPHLILLKKGEEVKVAYCRPIISQMFRDRSKHPGHNRCDEALTKGSFQLRQLQACSTKHSEEGGAAFNLSRQLKHVIESKENYHYHYLAMFGTRNEYRSLFQTCAAELRPSARSAAQPSNSSHIQEHRQESEGATHSGDAEPAPIQLNGTL